MYSSGATHVGRASPDGLRGCSQLLARVRAWPPGPSGRCEMWETKAAQRASQRNSGTAVDEVSAASWGRTKSAQRPAIHPRAGAGRQFSQQYYQRTVPATSRYLTGPFSEGGAARSLRTAW